MAEDGPNVRLHPPVVLLVTLAVAYGLKIALGGGALLPAGVRENVGGLLMIVAISLVIWSIAHFRQHRELLLPHTPSQHLMTDGPFRFSRNPIYLGMAIFIVGAGRATNNPWMIGSSLLFAAIIDLFVIRREEAYLAERFGDAYASYRSRVRRWL